MNKLSTVVVNPYVSLRIGHKPIGDGKNVNIFIKRELSEILEIAYFEMGSVGKMEANVVIAQTEALFKELCGKYSLMTLPEVKEAFRRGIRGESGPFFGMCPKTYHQFIKWFYELPERNNAWQEHLTQLSKVETTEKKLILSDAQLKQACIDAFNDYKAAKKMPFVPFAIYDQIKAFKGQKSLITGTRWSQVKDDGIELFKKRKSNGLTTKKAEVFLKTFVVDSEDENLRNTIKEVALRTYFEELILNGKELEL